MPAATAGSSDSMNSPWTEHPDPHPRASAPSRWLTQGLQLALLQRPRTPLVPGKPAHFALVSTLWLLGGLLLDDWLIEAPREFSHWALTERSFPLLVALAGAALVSSLLGRGRVALGLASVVLAALLPGSLIWIWLQAGQLASGWLPWLPALYFALLALQLVRWTARDLPVARRATGFAAALLLMAGSWQLVPDSPWWWSLDSYADYASEDPLDIGPSPDPISGQSPEQLWLAQPERMASALSRLAPQRPGVIDLYVLALAGDGSESVFRNEVGFVRQLAESRFDAKDRVLPLVNHPQTLDQAPIASVGNLRAALRGLAAVMDTDEDLLWLFLTSHGSEDHQLYLGLDPLPLDGLDPETLREALDEAGIGWRVIVVSACYSGGFIESLSDPRSLVITATRADRTSFGCGVQSDLTWFGEAFLTEALNATIDFPAAFRAARRSVRERERSESEQPSYPQIALGPRIAPHLRRWQSGVAMAPRVPFTVDMPLSAGEPAIKR